MIHHIPLLALPCLSFDRWRCICLEAMVVVEAFSVANGSFANGDDGLFSLILDATEKLNYSLGLAREPRLPTGMQA